jgi:hypothetical protein
VTGNIALQQSIGRVEEERREPRNVKREKVVQTVGEGEREKKDVDGENDEGGYVEEGVKGR